MSVARVPCPCRINSVSMSEPMYISIVYFYVRACGSVFVGMSASKPMSNVHSHAHVARTLKIDTDTGTDMNTGMAPCMDSNIGTSYGQGHGHPNS
jgi:hypothetical protein